MYVLKVLECPTWYNNISALTMTWNNALMACYWDSQPNKIEGQGCLRTLILTLKLASNLTVSLKGFWENECMNALIRLMCIWSAKVG